MNASQLRNLFIAAVLILGIGYFVFNSDEGSFKGQSKDQLSEVLPDLNLETVKKIVIQSPGSTVTLEEMDSKWTVADRGGYPADFTKVGKLAREIDELKVLTKEEVGESQMGRLELLPPDTDESEGAGTDIAFLSGSGEEVSRIRIGKAAKTSSTPDPMGMGMGGSSSGKFVMRPSDKSVFIVGENLASVDAEPSAWLNKSDFYKVSKPAMIQVSSSDPEVNWTMTRSSETDSWKLSDLTDDEKMSSSSANVLNNYMGFPSFTDIATDQSLMDNSRTIEVKTFEGFEYKFSVGEKTDDGKYPMTIAVQGNFPTERTPEEGESEEDKAKRDEEFASELKARQEKLEKEKALEGSIFLVNTWTVDNALKKRSEFLDTGDDEAAGGQDDGNAVSFDDIELPDDDGGLPDFLRRPADMPAPVLPGNGNEGRTAGELIREKMDEAVENTIGNLNIPDIDPGEAVDKAAEEAGEAAAEAAEAVEEANPWKDVENKDDSADSAGSDSGTTGDESSSDEE